VTCRSDFQKIVARIMKLDYSVPDKLGLSDSVKDLLGRVFVKDPAKRITIAEIKQHSWYLHRLPYELYEGYQGFERCAAAKRSLSDTQPWYWSGCSSAEERPVHVYCDCDGAHAGTRRARSTSTRSRGRSTWHDTQASFERKALQPA
jgi:serine/threonine protein kinase